MRNSQGKIHFYSFVVSDEDCDNDNDGVLIGFRMEET